MEAKLARYARKSSGVAAAAALATVAGCAATATSTRLPPSVRPIPIGSGPGYRIPATSRPVAARRQIDGLSCRKTPAGVLYGIHLELFANRLVVPVPAGIGVAPPLARSGAYVTGGACTYPLSTLEPTGVVRVTATTPLKLQSLFAIWGQRLSKTQLAGFKGPVLAFVDGRPWQRRPGAIPLTRHAEIVVEVGGALLPHPSYRFPPGL